MLLAIDLNWFDFFSGLGVGMGIGYVLALCCLLLLYGIGWQKLQDDQVQHLADFFKREIKIAVNELELTVTVKDDEGEAWKQGRSGLNDDLGDDDDEEDDDGFPGEGSDSGEEGGSPYSTNPRR